MKSIHKMAKQLVLVLDKHAIAFFLVISLLFGGLFAFTVPPLFGNDEIVHFPRAYQIQDGRMWEEKLTTYDYGGHVPVQIKWFNDDFRELVQTRELDEGRLRSLVKRYASERINNTERVTLPFTSAGIYAPWAYLPSALGVGIADALKLPILWYVWLGRIASLLVWIAMTAWALRLLPSGKLFMVAVALLPTSLVQAANLGMDGIVNGLSWVIIAMTFAIMAGKVRLTVPRGLVLAVLCFFLATTKQGYLPIALFPLIIPPVLYAFRSKYVNLVRILFAISLIGAGILYVLKTLPLAGLLHFTQRPEVYVNSDAQILHILQHPLQVLFIILIQPFTIFAGGVWAGTVGIITNKTIMLPVVVIGLLYLSLILAFVAGNKMYRFAGMYAQRVGLVSLGIAVTTFLLINLALYVAFTSVGNNRIEGLQGRYFLPFAPLAIGLVNLLPNKRHWEAPGWVYVMAGFGIFTGLATALYKLLQLPA